MKNMKIEELIKFLKKDIKIRWPASASRRSGRRTKKQKKTEFLLLGVVLVFFLLGIFGGVYFNDYIQEGLKTLLKPFSQIEITQPPEKTQLPKEEIKPSPYLAQTSQEEAVIKVVKKASPAVVSIIISKDMPIYEEYYENPLPGFPEFKIPQYRQKGTQKQKIGGGTGFIISQDGLILTNKHVVADTEAEYTAVTNAGKVYKIEVLARDPFQDLAVLKINPEDSELFQESFPVLQLSDSDTLQIGQTVIAIGNALGEFRNTVSVGVVSGLGRTITASGGGIAETLENVIQTDTAINRGNSGGPLLNLRGEVIGINVAMDQTAQSIGFAIPINKAKRDIRQIKTIGKIVYPFLGVRYILITPEIQEEKNLSVDYGALIVGGTEISEPAIVPDSAAEKAGLKEVDIILEVDKEKITSQNSLAKIIQKYNPGDKVILEVLRGEEKIEITAVLGEINGE